MRQMVMLVLCAVACVLAPMLGCGRRPKPNDKTANGQTAQLPPPKRLDVDLNGRRVGALYQTLAGGEIGKLEYGSEAGPAATKQSYNYRPSEGVRLVLRSAKADPPVLVKPDPPAAGSPGQVALEATYALMAPDDQQILDVTEVRVVTLNGEKQAEIRASASRTAGTHTSRVGISLPATVGRETYEILVTISVGGVSSQLKSSFLVR